MGARVVPTRSGTAKTGRVAPAIKSFGCPCAADWDNPRSDPRTVSRGTDQIRTVKCRSTTGTGRNTVDLLMNDMIIGLLASLAHSCGGNLGCAILVLSLGIRAALLPLTIKLARRARRNQEIMRALQPEIEQLKKRFEKKPELLFAETQKLYKKHGCNLLDLPAMAVGFIQLPIFMALYSSIRASISSTSAFLWIKNLASPDFYLTLVIISLTGLSVFLIPNSSAHMRNTLVAIQVVVTFFIVWKLAAGLGLYWVSSSFISLFQTLWLRYRTVPVARMG
jgi:YidC/Oxa1 family membrane protein insertase